MNGAGKKHTLRFDPRTELLLLVLANIVAFTQHSVWVENYMGCFLLLLIACLRVPKIRRQTGNRIWNLFGAAILCIPQTGRKF